MTHSINISVKFSFMYRTVACSDGGAGGAGHTLAPKKRGEKDVDLRPHTYVRTRGAKYRC